MKILQSTDDLEKDFEDESDFIVRCHWVHVKIRVAEQVFGLAYVAWKDTVFLLQEEVNVIFYWFQPPLVRAQDVWVGDTREGLCFLNCLQIEKVFWRGLIENVEELDVYREAGEKVLGVEFRKYLLYEVDLVVYGLVDMEQLVGFVFLGLLLQHDVIVRELRVPDERLLVVLLGNYVSHEFIGAVEVQSYAHKLLLRHLFLLLLADRFPVQCRRQVLSDKHVGRGFDLPRRGYKANVDVLIEDAQHLVLVGLRESRGGMGYLEFVFGAHVLRLNEELANGLADAENNISDVPEEGVVVCEVDGDLRDHQDLIVVVEVV